jgi:hypothetical protein
VAARMSTSFDEISADLTETVSFLRSEIDAVDEHLSRIGTDSQNGLDEFNRKTEESRRQLSELSAALRETASHFDGLFATILNGAASAVESINRIKNAVSTLDSVTAAINLLAQAYNIISAPDRAAATRDAFLSTFADANVVLYENGRRLRTAAEGAELLEQKLASLGAEGQRLVDNLRNAGNATEVAQAIAAVQEALANTPTALAEAAGFQTIEQLKTIAAQAVKTFEFMRDSGLYTAEAVQQAWEKANAALIASGDNTAIAADKAKAAIDKMKSELTSLTQSIADEAPEEVMGVIEAQTRAKIRGIEEQIKLEAAKSEAAKQQADELDGYLRELFGRGYVVPLEFQFEVPEFPGLSVGSIPQLASGGVVRRPTLALVGEAGPEAVVPLSQLSTMGGPATGSVTTVVQLDGRTVAQLTAPYMPGAARRYVRA